MSRLPEPRPLTRAYRDHDHAHCVKNALNTAREVCSRNGARFTRLREQVFTLIWSSHRPIGAYTILELLLENDPGARRPAPPTVYRALDFLLEQGLVHRINSLNAYIGCSHPGMTHHSQFLICKDCATTVEMYSQVSASLTEQAAAAEFQVERVLVEVTGLCPNCADQVH